MKEKRVRKMKTFYLDPIGEDIFLKKLSDKVEGEVLHYDRISSLPRKETYEIKDELDVKYLEHVKEIINDVGDFISDFLLGFLSSRRASFNYVRRHNIEFLKKYELLVEARVKTNREEKELLLTFDLPSSTYIPRVLLQIKGKYLYLYNHLKTRILFVIGNRENPKADDYFIDDALEELWHLAIYPHLIKKLNRELTKRIIKPSDYDLAEILLKEGEILSKAFVLASLADFNKNKGYDISGREAKGKEKVIADKIEKIGIKKALKNISRPGFLDF